MVSLFFCCSSKKDKPIEYFVLNPEFLTDSIYTRLPGSTLIHENYFLWTDPFSNEMFVKIIDLKSNQQVGEMLGIGQGPKEFITPSFGTSLINDVLIFDLNSGKMATLSIDSLLEKKEHLTVYGDKGDVIKDATRVFEFDENILITLTPTNDKPFLFWHNGIPTAFGKYPIETVINNSYDMFQGHLMYSPSHNLLLFSTYNFPYIALYEIKNNTINLVRDVFTDKMPSHTIIQGKMKVSEETRGPIEITMTKDYIAVLQYDREDMTPSNYQNAATKRPQTLFLYDYDLNLIKVVNVQKPIMRLASSEDNNAVYAIVLDPEYTLVKIDL